MPRPGLNLLLFIIFMAALVSCRQREPGANLSPNDVKRFRDSISRLDSLAVACMNSDTLKAREYATRAVALATLTRSDESLISALGIKGLVLKTAQDDSARYFLNLALRLSRWPGKPEITTGSPRCTTRMPMC